MVEEIKWKDEYNVGIDYVDQAHKKLFGILTRINRLLEDENSDKDAFACREAVKFLDTYTREHFAQEEGYMVKIGYSGYEAHKELHDNLRDRVLPDMAGRLEKSNYAREDVKAFTAFVAGWLAGHILIEDQAITGKMKSRWEGKNSDNEAVLVAEWERFSKDVIGVPAELINSHYEGQAEKNCFYYEMEFKSGGRVTMLADNRVVMKTAGNILGEMPKVLDKNTLLAYVEIAQSIGKAAINIVDGGEGDHHFVSHTSIKPEDLEKRCREKLPDYAKLWDTELGRIGICISL